MLGRGFIHNAQRKMSTHRGHYFPLEKLAVSRFSTKKNINVKISTEEKMIGVDDAMSIILCSR